MSKYGNRRWYVVQTYSGCENSVKTDLEQRIINLEQEDKIFNILVPEEEYLFEKKDGTKVPKTRKIFPGYLFVEMIVDERSWFIVRNTKRVTGFLGSSGNGTLPVPVPPEEINAILRKVGQLDAPIFDIAVGDTVRVISGAFAGKTVEVSSVSEEKETVTVLTEVFGRLTPTDLNIADVEKVVAE